MPPKLTETRLTAMGIICTCRSSRVYKSKSTRPIRCWELAIREGWMKLPKLSNSTPRFDLVLGRYSRQLRSWWVPGEGMVLVLILLQELELELELELLLYPR